MAQGERVARPPAAAARSRPASRCARVERLGLRQAGPARPVRDVVQHGLPHELVLRVLEDVADVSGQVGRLGSVATSWPSTRIAPGGGRRMPAISRASVLLPVPFAPTIATSSPDRSAEGQVARGGRGGTRILEGQRAYIDQRAGAARLRLRELAPAPRPRQRLQVGRGRGASPASLGTSAAGIASTASSTVSGNGSSDNPLRLQRRAPAPRPGASRRRPRPATVAVLVDHLARRAVGHQLARRRSSTTARSTSGITSSRRCSTTTSVWRRARSKLAEQRHHLGRAGRVELGRRLVQHQDLGLLRQHAGQRQPLLLAAGEPLDPVVAAVAPARPPPARRRSDRPSRRAGRPGSPGRRRPRPRRSSMQNCASGSWKTIPTRCARSAIEARRVSRPSTRTVPRRSPAMACGIAPFRQSASVLLPQPLGPSTSTDSPSRTRSERSRSVGCCRPTYLKLSPSISITDRPVAGRLERNVAPARRRSRRWA